MCGSLGQRRKPGPYQVGPGSSLVASSGPSCWATAVGLRPPRRSVSAPRGNSTTERSPATTMAAPIAGLSMPSSIPIPVAATMKGSEVACNRAAARETPLPYHRPVQGGRQPAGEQQRSRCETENERYCEGYRCYDQHSRERAIGHPKRLL